MPRLKPRHHHVLNDLTDKMLGLFGYRGDALGGRGLGDLLSGAETVSEWTVPGSVVTLYVDPASGDDVTATGGRGRPFRTYQAAVDYIPDGFACHVVIESLGGVSDETAITIRARPAAPLSDYSTNYPASLVKSTSITFLGARTRLTEESWSSTGNGTPVTSGSVQKSTQYTRTLSPSWGFALDYTHRYMGVEKWGQSYTGFVTRPAHSDEGTGTICLVHSGGGAGQYEAYHNGKEMSFYSLDSSFSAYVDIISESQVPVEFSGFTFSAGASFTDVSVSQSNIIGSLSLIAVSGYTYPTARGCHVVQDGLYYGVYSYGLENTVPHILQCVIEDWTNIASSGNVQATVLTADAGRLLVKGGRSLNSGYIDCEGLEDGFDTGQSILLYQGSIFTIYGPVTFAASTNPIHVAERSQFIVASGPLRGRCTGPILVETGSIVTGAKTSSITNTDSAGEEIKVGGRAVQALSTLPANDFCTDAGAYLATSQGCSAS